MKYFRNVSAATVAVSVVLAFLAGIGGAGILLAVQDTEEAVVREIPAPAQSAVVPPPVINEISELHRDMFYTQNTLLVCTDSKQKPPACEAARNTLLQQRYNRRFKLPGDEVPKPPLLP